MRAILNILKSRKLEQGKMCVVDRQLRMRTGYRDARFKDDQMGSIGKDCKNEQWGRMETYCKNEQPGG
jgi:hypothetical protein